MWVAAHFKQDVKNWNMLTNNKIRYEYFLWLNVSIGINELRINYFNLKSADGHRGLIKTPSSAPFTAHFVRFAADGGNLPGHSGKLPPRKQQSAPLFPFLCREKVRGAEVSRRSRTQRPVGGGWKRGAALSSVPRSRKATRTRFARTQLPAGRWFVCTGNKGWAAVNISFVGGCLGEVVT